VKQDEGRGKRGEDREGDRERIMRRQFPRMNDLIYVGIVVAFFVGSGLYVRFCEKL